MERTLLLSLASAVAAVLIGVGTAPAPAMGSLDTLKALRAEQGGIERVAMCCPIPQRTAREVCVRSSKSRFTCHLGRTNLQSSISGCWRC
jgi:hypothetical protein